MVRNKNYICQHIKRKQISLTHFYYDSEVEVCFDYMIVEAHFINNTLSEFQITDT